MNNGLFWLLWLITHFVIMNNGPFLRWWIIYLFAFMNNEPFCHHEYWTFIGIIRNEPSEHRPLSIMNIGPSFTLIMNFFSDKKCTLWITNLLYYEPSWYRAVTIHSSFDRLQNSTSVPYQNIGSSLSQDTVFHGVQFINNFNPQHEVQIEG